MSGKALNKKNQEVDIGFDVDVVASVGWEWEEDEQPTGWNHKTDTITYSSSTYASCSDVTVDSVTFSQDTNFIINNEEVSLHEAQQYIDPAVLKQLLNPAVYEKLMGSAFESKVENIEPPEQEFDEPERDYDY
jgi:DUF2075 family protein